MLKNNFFLKLEVIFCHKKTDLQSLDFWSNFWGSVQFPAFFDAIFILGKRFVIDMKKIVMYNSTKVLCIEQIDLCKCIEK